MNVEALVEEVVAAMIYERKFGFLLRQFRVFVMLYNEIENVFQFITHC